MNVSASIENIYLILSKKNLKNYGKFFKIFHKNIIFISFIQKQLNIKKQMYNFEL